ncbi:transcription factor KUA1-like [Vicia villosa]|uniref:transcription factor KUA1-like n=1 Tax=Vicia villosa TaxID=3911 RepID=UPI00273BFEDC|nr:transcription factor KUA1-like [Vicia villosa]
MILKKRKLELNLNEIPQDSGNESHAITNLNDIPKDSGNESHEFTNGQVAVIMYPPESNMDLAAQEPSRSRRPTIHWKLQEHELFLEGVKQFGKGKWKEISKMVATKSPSQHPSETENDKSQNIGCAVPQSVEALREVHPAVSSVPQSVEPLREIHPAGTSVPQSVEPLREIHPAGTSVPQSVEPLREIHPICLIRTIDITPQDMEKVKKTISLLEEALKA